MMKYTIYFCLLDPPELTIIRRPEGELREGSSLTLFCIVDSRPKPTSISWNNITVSGLPSLGCSYRNETDCTFTVASLDILHSGIYECRADNGLGRPPATSQIVVDVFGQYCLCSYCELNLLASWLKLVPLIDEKNWLVMQI